MLEVRFYHRDPELDSNEPDILLLNGRCSESGLCENATIMSSAVHVYYLYACNCIFFNYAESDILHQP